MSFFYHGRQKRIETYKSNVREQGKISKSRVLNNGFRLKIFGNEKRWGILGDVGLDEMQAMTGAGRHGD